MAINAQRVLQAWIFQENPDENAFMASAIPEIVLVFQHVPDLLKKARYWNLSSCHRSIIKFIVGNSYRRSYASLSPGRIERMKVVVQLPHRILDGNVQIPELVGLWDVDHSPDRALDSVQRNSESYHPSGPLTHVASFGT